MENTAYGTQAIQNIYLVCDTYKEGSVKTGERRARATGKKYMLKSPDMKLHSDFCSFHENEDINNYSEYNRVSYH